MIYSEPVGVPVIKEIIIPVEREVPYPVEKEVAVPGNFIYLKCYKTLCKMLILHCIFSN